MGLDYVDIFYSHRPDPETPLEETMGALDQAVRSGKALYAGISNYPPAETRRAAESCASLGTPCLIHQPNYSMFDRWIEEACWTCWARRGSAASRSRRWPRGCSPTSYLAGIPDGSRAAKPHGFLRPEHVTDEQAGPGRGT